MLTTAYNDALDYAAWLHRHQVRKATQIPYITHPVAVSLLAVEYGATETEAIAALLHDALEDGPRYNRCSLLEIQQQIITRFGTEVLAIVADCTEDEQLYPNWWDRKRAYIDRLPQAAAAAQLVSCCDTLHNLLCILQSYEVQGEILWQRFNQGRDGVMFYYPALGKTFAASKVREPLLTRLNAAIAQLQSLN